MFTSDIEIVDGWVIVGDRPGLGLEIDREALEKQRVDAIPAGSGPGRLDVAPGPVYTKCCPRWLSRLKRRKEF